jgi:hypothetical protein
MPTIRISYLTWLQRLVTWDGLLPVMLLAVPLVFRRLLPEANDNFRMAFSVSILMIAFWVRLGTALPLVANNRGTERLKKWQYIALAVALYALMMFESFAFAYLSAWQEEGISVDQWITLGFLWTSYFALMTFTLFPGSEPRLGPIVFAGAKKLKA